MNQAYIEWRKKEILHRLATRKYHNTTDYQREVLDEKNDENFDERPRVK
jgi:hypothetical protein